MKGQYAFVVSGSGTAGFFAVAGSFKADGAGGLTGAMDINRAGGISQNLGFTGTYTVLANGQGSATFISSAQTINLRMVVVSVFSNSPILLASLDAGSPGHGRADMQDTLAFSTAGVKGQVVLNLLGVDSSGSPTALLGGFNTDGAGAIPPGVHDVSDNGVLSTNQALIGSYSVPAGSSGRGTLTLNTALGVLHFAFYIVDATHWKVVETERAPALAGETLTGSNGSVSVPGCGPCVTVWTGFSGTTPFAAAGIFGLDDAGGASNAQLTANNGGTVSSLAFASGSYSYAPQFRGTITFNGGTIQNFALYKSERGVLMLRTDPGTVITGIAVIQALAGGPHLDLTFDGSFAFNSFGMLASGQPEEIGQVTTQDPQTNGTGPLTGLVDFNQGGAVRTNLAVTGSFTMTKTATGTADLQTSLGTQHFALRSAGSDVLFVSTDPNLIAAGVFTPHSH